MLITGLEATENHVKVLAFYKAVEPQFIEQCEYGRRLARGGDQEAEPVGTARLLRPRRCMSSEHFGQLAWQFKRMSGSSGLKVQAAMAC